MALGVDKVKDGNEKTFPFGCGLLRDIDEYNTHIAAAGNHDGFVP